MSTFLMSLTLLKSINIPLIQAEIEAKAERELDALWPQPPPPPAEDERRTDDLVGKKSTEDYFQETMVRFQTSLNFW